MGLFRCLECVEQTERKGLGHAIFLTESLVEEEPVLIVYGDTIFEGDLRNSMDDRVDGTIGVKVWIYLGELFPKDFKRAMSEEAIEESSRGGR